MPERGFSTDYWADTFVESLPPEGKLLYAYLWTNPHCNQAGLYEITLERIVYETKLPPDSLPSLLKSLEPKVKWYPEQNLVWVKNFIKRQLKSPKFLIAAAKSLSAIHNNGAVSELLEYNLKRYTISIPYPYSKDTVLIPSISVSVSSAKSNANADKLGVVKGEEGESEAKELFDLWNSLGVIKHKKLTGDMTRAIQAVSRDFSVAEISQAMKNYARIVNDEQCFFKYRWTMKDFLKRGSEKFLDLEVALNNYRKGGAGGVDKRHFAQDTKGKRDSHGPLR